MFVNTRERILEYIEKQETDFSESMESHRLTLTLSDNRSYRDNVVLIKNNFVIREILAVIITRINQKIEEIEKEILK